MSERFNSLKKIAHGAGLTFLFSAGAYGVTFFFKLLAARYFSQEAFGQFVLGETVLNIIVLVVGLGITEGVQRYIPVYRERGHEAKLTGYLRFVFLTPLLGALLVGAALFFSAPWVTSFFGFPEGFTLFLKILSFGVPLSAFQKITSQILITERRVGLEAFIQPFFEELVKLVGMSLIMFYDLGVLSLIVLLLVSVAVTALLNGVSYLVLVPLRPSGDSKYDLRDWLSFSLPLFLTSFLTMFISWTDNFVIGKFLEPSDLAVYSIAFSIAGTLKVFYKSLNSLFTPILSEYYGRDDLASVKFLFKRVTAWVFGLSVPAFLVMVFYSEEILRLLYGGSYAEGWLVLVIVAIGMLVNVSVGPAAAILNIVKETNNIFYADVAAATLNVAGNLVLVPMIGLQGAALASSASLIVNNVLYIWWAKQEINVGFDWVYYVKFVAAGLPAAFVSALLFRVFSNTILQVVTAGVTYAALYLVLLFALNTFHEKDYEMLEAVAEYLGFDVAWLTSYVRWE